MTRRVELLSALSIVGPTDVYNVRVVNRWGLLTHEGIELTIQQVNIQSIIIKTLRRDKVRASCTVRTDMADNTVAASTVHTDGITETIQAHIEDFEL